MAKYSKAHERDENARMWRGFWHSTFGILLCWVPLLGLILSISGFARQVVRMTQKHKTRLVIFTIYGLLSLMISIGAIVGGLYAYSRDQDLFKNAGNWVWKHITGQDTLPGQTAGTDYGSSDMPGLGVYEDGAGLGDDEGDILDDEQPEDEYTDDEEVDDEYFDDEENADDEEDPDSEEELDEDDSMVYDMDFDFEAVDEDYFEVDGQDCVTYKVTLDKEEPTDEDLFTLFDFLAEDDGFMLHNLYIYSDESEVDGQYTVAALEQKVEGEKPTLTRK